MEYHYLLMSAFSMQQKLLMRRLKDTPLSSGQPKVLSWLSGHDGARQSEIAAACVLEAASVTSVIDGMEKKGLVTRSRDANNRRTIHIHLTEMGKELSQRVNDEFRALKNELFAQIGQENGERLHELLEQVYQVLLKDI